MPDQLHIIETSSRKEHQQLIQAEVRAGIEKSNLTKSPDEMVKYLEAKSYMVKTQAGRLTFLVQAAYNALASRVNLYNWGKIDPPFSQIRSERITLQQQWLSYCLN